MRERMDLDKNTDVFLEDYQKHTLDKSSKQALGRLLSKINITPIKLSGNAGYKYKKSCEELISEYNKNNWMDDDNDGAIPNMVYRFRFRYCLFAYGIFRLENSRK